MRRGAAYIAGVTGYLAGFVRLSAGLCATWRMRPSGPDGGLVQPAAYGLPTARRMHRREKGKGKREKKAREHCALYSHAYIVKQNFYLIALLRLIIKFYLKLVLHVR